jgi:hypothetical protein
MLNVANLEARHFAAILSGRKRTEWRHRVRGFDSRLEAVTVGEPVALLEIGSNRMIQATVRAKSKFEYDDGSATYAIRLADPKLKTAPAGLRKLQGWHRRQTLTLPK